MCVSVIWYVSPQDTAHVEAAVCWEALSLRFAVTRDNAQVS